MSSPTILTDEKEYGELSKYDYPFENLVFNGGGAKCIADIGTLKVLEDLGILPKIKRFAGTSGGALTAAFAAMKYPVTEIEELLNTNLEALVKGSSSWNPVTWIRIAKHLYNDYGVYTADAFEHFLAKHIERKMGDPGKVTFQKLFTEGTELAITAVDIVREECVFFHVKTTPDMPILKAMRMSMSIPGLFTPVKMDGDNMGFFVDGGLLRNYPIMSFDGWYLSMEVEDAFLVQYKSIQSDDPGNFSKLHDKRFEGYNDKTLGVMVYSANQGGVFVAELEERNKSVQEVPMPPDEESPLAKKRRKHIEKIKKVNEEHQQKTRAMAKLIQALPDIREKSITLDQFKRALEQVSNATVAFVADGPGATLSDTSDLVALLALTLPGDHTNIKKLRIKPEPTFVADSITEDAKASQSHLTKDEVQLLLGNYKSAEDLFNKIDIRGKKEINFVDVVRFAENKGLKVLGEFHSAIAPKEIKGYRDYLHSILTTSQLHVSRGILKGKDIERTIGINTGHIDTQDFDMKKADRAYIIKKGKLGTVAFLREWIKKHPEAKKED